MNARPAPRPLLLVLAHGVGVRELEHVRRAAGGVEPSRDGPIVLPGRPVHTFVHELDATNELRDLGIDVDRRALRLRPAWRTDASVAAALGRRATGRAPVTIFEATSVLAQAAAGGVPAALAAAGELGRVLGDLAARLRHGDAPELWLVGLGSAVAVHTCFDLEAEWRRHVVPPLAHEVRLRVQPGVAAVTAGNVTALEHVARIVARGVFAERTHVQRPRPGELRLLARPGVAFARRRVAARAAHADELRAIASLPRERGEWPADLAAVAARFWMRAVELHLPREATATAPAAAPVLGDVEDLSVSRS